MSSTGNSTFLIPYEYLYKNVFVSIKPLYYCLIILWVITLFYCMYSIADRHFTWALEHLARAFRLSSDLAGLTLLAFGNGAPDFFTAVLGAAEEPEMILGSSVGSGLFIVTVVFGLVLLLAREPGKNRAIIQTDGTRKEVMGGRKTIFQYLNVRHSLKPIAFLRSAGMYLFCVGFLFLLSLVRRIPFWLPLLPLGIYLIYLGTCIALHFGLRRTESLSRAASEVTEDQNFEEKRMMALTRFQGLSSAEKLFFALKTTCLEDALTKKGCERTFRLFLIFLKSPVDCLLNLTILPIEEPEKAAGAENYVSLRFLHRIRCITNPFFSIFLYIFLLGPGLFYIPWLVWIVHIVTSSLMGLTLWFFTSWTGPPRFFPLHVIYSFCTSILWIYATSSELLACLSSNGNLLGISPTMIGILVLAWGNSFGDLVADVAIAKNGSFETAVTAIFSGPVQNVLLTIGSGFLVAAIRSSSHEVLITSLRSDIYIALVLLALVVLLCLMIVPLKYDFLVSRNFGVVLLAIYLLYLPFAFVFGSGLLRIPFDL